MIIERSLHPDWLSNTYLVGDEPGGKAVAIDAGGPSRPLMEKAEAEGLEVTHLLLTHHHHDHVCDMDAVKARYPKIIVMAHPDEPIESARRFVPTRIGDVLVDAIHTPGHTAGMLNFTVDGHVFTGDTLFKHSIGGVRAPGSTSYEDIKHSIMEELMTLDPDTEVHPGHTDPTTIGHEWEHNAFIRVWRGLDPEGDEQVVVLGEPATLIVWGDDYDGGHKAWVRWADGRDDIVPGSKVERSS
jgi:glyoxylase-like metal-dependent hydrolase (beta-lactamase superfamily II)